MTWVFGSLAAAGVLAMSLVVACVRFDQAVLTRKGTVYRAPVPTHRIAITFDDGPSPVWTLRILDQLDRLNIKATFFMLGRHVEAHPEVARLVAERGHLLGNHGYTHRVLLYYTPSELEEEVRRTERIIREVTGQTTRYFRPPKGWLTPREKRQLAEMGYTVVLWSRHSKDWVRFGHNLVVNHFLSKVEDGDIVLFHDAGGVFKTEGGNRAETVAALPLLARKVRERGLDFTTIEELLDGHD